CGCSTRRGSNCATRRANGSCPTRTPPSPTTWAAGLAAACRSCRWSAARRIFHLGETVNRRANAVIMKIEVDFTKCTGLGICESIAPDFFEVGADGDMVLLKDELTDADRQAVEEAVSGCPTEALRIRQD